MLKELQWSIAKELSILITLGKCMQAYLSLSFKVVRNDVSDLFSIIAVLHLYYVEHSLWTQNGL